MYKIKVKSDKLKAFQEKRAGFDSPVAYTPPEVVPVDMYGNRVNLDMNDPTNLAKTAEDIQESRGLESLTNEPDNGGLATEDDENSDF